MKSLFLKMALVVTAIALYIGAPFVTAWFIREAVRTGNSGVLAYTIEWPSLRETLKPAIARIALNLPEPEPGNAQKPGLWTRFKMYWGQGTVDRMVDTYVTPEGLPQLFTLRKAYRDFVSSDVDEAQTMSLPERIAKAWSRVKRAEFTSLTSFEIDMEDKYDSSRLFLGKMRLTTGGWKLTELRVKFLTTAKNTVEKLSSFEDNAL